VAGHARGGDLQGRRVIPLGEQGPGGLGEPFRPALGQQVERGGPLGRGDGIQPLPVALPVAGVLAVLMNASSVMSQPSPSRVNPGPRPALRALDKDTVGIKIPTVWDV